MKTVKKITIYLLLQSLVLGLVDAQNLVINGDFEKANICRKYEEHCSPLAWRSNSLKLFGYHTDRRNGSFISTVLFNAGRKNERKFAQTELLCPLEEGEIYQLKLQILPSGLRIDEIHIGFPDSMHLSEKSSWDHYRINRYVSFEIPKKIKQGRWLELETTYQAAGGEKFILIGNLLKDSLTQVAPIYKIRKKELHKIFVKYGIDKVSIRKLHSESEDCLDKESERRRIIKDSIRHSIERLNFDPSTSNTLAETIPDPPPPSLTHNPSPTKKEVKIILHDLRFEFDDSKIIKGSAIELERVLELLRQTPSLNAKLVGYTDSVGEADYNLKLSLARANAVKTYLLEQQISADRISVDGKGEENPIANGIDDASRQLNRRVEVILSEKVK